MDYAPHLRIGHIAGCNRAFGETQIRLFFGESDEGGNKSAEGAVASGQWLVVSKGRMVMPYDLCKELSGFNSLAEINRINEKDLSLYATISERRDLWFELTDPKGGGVDSVFRFFFNVAFLPLIG